MISILVSCCALCIKHDITNKDPARISKSKTLKDTLLKLADLSWSMYFYAVQKFYSDYQEQMAKKDPDSNTETGSSIMYYLSAISLGFSIFSFMMVYFMVLNAMIANESTEKKALNIVGAIVLINVVFGLITYSMSIASSVDYDCWAHTDTINNPIRSSCTFENDVPNCDYDGVQGVIDELTKSGYVDVSARFETFSILGLINSFCLLFTAVSAFILQC
mmetsp:Transcript_34814/g.25151  ORF Transcript_34814/g.25151 Transcript_34814/m.25151 type:complete len:219 (-) Transcript_34814:425-1081(-)